VKFIAIENCKQGLLLYVQAGQHLYSPTKALFFDVFCKTDGKSSIVVFTLYPTQRLMQIAEDQDESEFKPRNSL
jgi:Zn/Cd-binding protein ZinT